MRSGSSPCSAALACTAPHRVAHVFGAAGPGDLWGERVLDVDAEVTRTRKLVHHVGEQATALFFVALHKATAMHKHHHRQWPGGRDGRVYIEHLSRFAEKASKVGMARSVRQGRPGEIFRLAKTKIRRFSSAGRASWLAILRVDQANPPSPCLDRENPVRGPSHHLYDDLTTVVRRAAKATVSYGALSLARFAPVQPFQRHPRLT
jgi:hypothetical protein